MGAAGTPRIAFGGAALAFLAGAAGLGLLAGITSGDMGELGRVVLAAVAYVPAIWVVTAIAVALFGLLPRWTTLAWAPLAVAAVFGMFGTLLDVPGAVLNVSPFEVTPRVSRRLVGRPAARGPARRRRGDHGSRRRRLPPPRRPVVTRGAKLEPVTARRPQPPGRSMRSTSQPIGARSTTKPSAAATQPGIESRSLASSIARWAPTRERLLERLVVPRRRRRSRCLVERQHEPLARRAQLARRAVERRQGDALDRRVEAVAGVRVGRGRARVLGDELADVARRRRRARRTSSPTRDDGRARRCRPPTHARRGADHAGARAATAPATSSAGMAASAASDGGDRRTPAGTSG